MTAHTVFISNMNVEHDYTKAAKYGAVRPITSGNYPIFRNMRLMEEIEDVLVHSTEDDYLLLSGSSVVAGLCAVVWLQLHRKMQLLLFDRKQESYVPRMIVRDDIILDIERAIDRAEKLKELA